LSSHKGTTIGCSSGNPNSCVVSGTVNQERLWGLTKVEGNMTVNAENASSVTRSSRAFTRQENGWRDGLSSKRQGSRAVVKPRGRGSTRVGRTVKVYNHTDLDRSRGPPRVGSQIGHFKSEPRPTRSSHSTDTLFPISYWPSWPVSLALSFSVVIVDVDSTPKHDALE
jgi:hypothetical protein